MATTLTPAQQQALQGFLDYTKAKNSESTPATTSQTQGVASLASTPASTSQTQGVASLASTPATTSQTQGIASLNTQPWWVGQFASEADANYVDTNRNQKIEDTERAAWRSRYDPNSTEYQTRVADSQAASTSNNTTTKSTTTGNTQPNWEQDFTGRGVIRYINPVTGEKVLSDVYLETANTPEAIKYRTDNASFLNFDKKSGLYGRDSVQKVWNAVDTYLDPAEGKDYTENLKWYLAKQLTDRGITDLGQIEKKVTPEGNTKYYNVKTGEDFDPLLFDDKAGTKYIVTSNGIQKQFDPNAKVAAQASQYISPSSSGGAWGYFGTQGMVNQIGRRIRDLTGVDDINDLELKTVTKPRGVAVNADGSGRFYVREGDESRYLTDEEVKTIRSEDYISGDNMAGTNFYAEVTLPTKGVYNKKTGQLIADQKSHSWLGRNEAVQIGLGGWGEGEGMTYANLKFDANGKPVIETWGKNTSDIGKILPAISLLTLPFGGIGGLLSGITGTAGVGGLAGAALGELGLNTAGTGIAGALASTGIGELAANIGANALVQGTVTGGISELMGGDFSKGFGVGAATGGFGAAAGTLVNSTANTLIDAGVPAEAANIAAKSLVSGVGSGGISELAGGDFSKGFTTGAVSSGVASGVDALSKAAGVDKGLGSLAGPTKSLVSSALTSAALDRPFDIGEAVKNTALNYGLNQAIQAAGFTPKQTTAMNKFLKFAGPMLATRRKPAGG